MNYQEGYYLTAFVCIDELQNVLDIKLRHDQAIALWRYKDSKIELVRYWELERLSGIKEHPKALYDTASFNALIDHLLNGEGISRKDIIGIWGSKGIEPDTRYRDQFKTGIAFHNIAHLLTALFFSNSRPFKDTILAMALDAGPDSQFEEDAYDLEYYSGGVISNGKLEIFNVESPARLWSYAKKKLDLREGTLMALASATHTEYVAELPDYTEQQFTSRAARESATVIVDDLYERIFSLTMNEIGINCTSFDPDFSDTENRISMLMKIVSKVSEDIVFRNIEYAVKKYNLKIKRTTIGLAGGFALNCPTNTNLLNKYPFKSYQIPPCTSDTGIAMGIGLALFYPLLSSEQATINIDSAYFGDAITNDNITSIARQRKDVISSIDIVSIDEVAKDIIEKSVIVWVNDCAEVGPRALGNRSLIGDPRIIRTKDMLNNIKKREWWRPVSPMINERYGNEYFKKFLTSPNMLLNFKVRSGIKDKIPAVVHLDGTSRAQTVSKKNNPTVYKLLNAFNKLTNVPVLCNTSLNDAGEPIINTIEEAIDFCLHKGLDAVYVNGTHRINIKNSKDEIDLPARLRNQRIFSSGHVDKEAVIKRLNPFDLSTNELTYYYDNPSIFLGMKLTQKKDVEVIRIITTRYLQNHPTALIR
jgi:carbamoyltransferase